ncbi:MAG: hypothetical protein K0S97_1415 [Chloroflexota bacterium]|jgi:hypothetical protein|nr:hypothetical protein [Chloroflexota bacterium]
MDDQDRAVETADRRTSRRRRVMSAIALVLACLSIVVTTVGIWTHQVALNTNRFSTLIESVVTDPAIVEPVSARISTQVVDALDVQGRLETRLPDALKPLAGALTASVRNAIDTRLRVAFQDPRIQAALVNSLSFTHTQVVRLLRDEFDAVGVADGYVTLDVFPVVGAALTELQTMGIIPADVQLPDLTAPEAPEALAQRLESALGVTLPPDFGTIQLMPADRLEAARSVVRIFDLVVILLVILTTALVALTLWLARDRRRTLIYLGIGTIIAFLVARLAIRSAEDLIVAGIADANIAGATRAMVDTTLQDLRGLTLIIVVATAILAIAAYLWGRPRWVTVTTTYVGDAAGRAGSAASASVAGAAGRAPDRDTLTETVRQNRPAIERIGLGVIAFILVWLAAGLEIALLGAALIVGLQVVLRAVSSEPDEEVELVASDPDAA